MTTETDTDLDQIEIEIPDADGAPDKGAEGGKPDAIAELERQITELKRASDDEARKRRAADADAERARQELAQTRREVADTQVDAIGNAIAAEEAAAAAAERDYAAAMEAGDYGKAATAQRAMARAEAQLTRLQESKADAETRKAAPPERPSETDRVEAYISNFPSERTRSWLRDHRDCVTDPEKNSLMIAAHHRAVRDGLTPDTDAYFAAIEQRLGFRDADPDEADQNRKPAPAAGGKRQSTPYAAPVSRDAPASGGARRPGVVTLTAAEREIADTMAAQMGIPVAEARQNYARNKIAMQQSGELK